MKIHGSILLAAIALAGVASVAQAAKAPLAPDLRRLRTVSGCAQISAASPYFDHAQALLGRAARGAAEKLAAKRRWKGAEARAREARQHWLRIQERFASSPWLKHFQDEMGLAGLIIAEAQLRMKQPDLARDSYERAWDRISFSLIEPRQIAGYFEACRRTTPNFWKDPAGTSCANWSRRLLAAFPAASVERAQLAKEWPQVTGALSDVAMPEIAPRVQQSYKSTDADQAAWEAILPDLREGRLRRIEAPLREFIEKYPRSALLQKARYWLVAAQAPEGEVPQSLRPLLESVARESPLGFYGMLAARRLGREPSEFLADATPESKAGDLRLHPSEVAALRKAEALLQSGDPALGALARMELREVRPKPAHESEFLVYLADLNSRAGSHLGAFLAVTELIRRGAPQAATTWAARVVFPADRWPLAAAGADDRGIDPVWVLSLMKQESAFDVEALSSSGAVGLMQVMPATAVDTDPAITRRGLPEDAANIRIGTTYMARMLERFRGNIALATAAYNAGPVAVERWMKDFGLKDTDSGLSLGILEFIESIPYPETRDYVGSILRNYDWYSRRLPRELKVLPKSFAGPRPLQYFWTRRLPLPGNN